MSDKKTRLEELAIKREKLMLQQRELEKKKSALKEKGKK